jgi:hypothetical protein
MTRAPCESGNTVSTLGVSVPMRVSLRSSLVTALVSFTSLACGASSAPPPVVLAPTAPPAPEVPGAAALLKPGGLLMVGEWHGTEEFPALVGALAKEAAQRGAVTVHLEIAQAEQARVDRLFRERGAAPPPSDGIWGDPYQYGVTSHAMWALIVSLRDLALETGHVRLHLMDPGSPKNPGPADGRARDRGMADAVIADVHAHPGDIHLALAGNVHSRLEHGVPWDAEYDPFARNVKSAGIPVTSLLGAFGGGSSWSCETPKAESCGVKDVEPNTKQSAEPARLEISKEHVQGGHDGYAFVGTLHASRLASVPSGSR